MQITINKDDGNWRKEGQLISQPMKLQTAIRSYFLQFRTFPPFSHLTMGPEKASDICQTQMAHLESGCVSVYRQSGRINREGVDIYVCWKLLISAMTTWTCCQIHCKQDWRDIVPLRNLICNGPHLRKMRYCGWTALACIANVSQPSKQEIPLGKRISRGLFCNCMQKQQTTGPGPSCK